MEPAFRSKIDDKTVHCALCAIPCISPPPISPSVSLSPSSRSPISTFESDSASKTLLNPYTNWLSDLIALRYTSTPPPPPIPAPGPALGPTVHQITLHTYCLSAARQLGDNGPGEIEDQRSGGAVGRRVNLWNLPKWVGYVDWNEAPLTIREESGGMKVGGTERGDEVEVGEQDGSTEAEKKSWKGLDSQLERWKLGKAHYRDIDLIDPTLILDPSPDHNLQKRSATPSTELVKDCLTSLPPHILLQITSCLLDPPTTKHHTTPSLTSSAKSIPHPDLFALLQTCSFLRVPAFSHTFWADIVRDSVGEYKQQLKDRWDTSGRTEESEDTRLLEVFHREFNGPVDIALKEALANNTCSYLKDSSENGYRKAGYTARDVWDWWMFSDAWRSKRRVWRSVVYGCARARELNSLNSPS